MTGTRDCSPTISREQRRLILVFHASEDQRSIALNPFLAQLPHDVRQWTIQSMPRMKAFQEQVFGKGNTRSQWYLQRIGIIPDRQGEGIGTELLDMVRDKVSEPARRNRNMANAYLYVGWPPLRPCGGDR